MATLHGSARKARARNPQLVAFVWDAVGGASSYVLQIGTSTGQSDRYNSNVGNVLTYTLTLLPGTYYSRVVPQGAGSTTVEQVVSV